MEEREWIVSPKQLRANQKKGESIKTTTTRELTWEETPFYRFCEKLTYFMAGVVSLVVLLVIMA